MSSQFGKTVKVTLFGESHGAAVGAVVEGFPAGEALDLSALSAFLQRRRGGGPLSTPRREADEAEILSGVTNGFTNGAPLCLIMRNQNADSRDYERLKNIPRPGHADYTAYVKWNGFADARGGGHFSGRLTAPLCAAGGIAKQILKRRGVFVGARLLEAGGVPDEPLPEDASGALFDEIAKKPIPAYSAARGDEMARVIQAARDGGDSVGGIAEAYIFGLPAGLGSPMFEGVENRLAQALFGIPAVKGVEFGEGFRAAKMRGSENNDAFYSDGSGKILTRTNHAGGALGGITTGMPIVARAAFKPTPSIARRQETVNLADGSLETIEISGRHDPCVALRAVPAVEAVCALAALDLLSEGA